VTAFVLVVTSVAAADAGELERRIDESLALCAAADELAPEARRPVLARGLALADAALALDERSARAHFAVVCNLGKSTSLGGVGFGTFRNVYRLQREIDVTLALAPDDPEALTAKGALLMRLPAWLGGDRDEAVRWLRRALAVDPHNQTARAYLDEVEGRGGFVAPAAADTTTAR
jgi:tetratricopeptide (TPR) repeat protein